MVQEGYIVLNLDYRDSRGYGRDFRTGIYRHMGETEVRSGLAAVEYLVTEQGVDRERIGLFGGSYGGFFTLMSMCKHPGVFKAGAVRAPVTDWAHYNHGYTTRILNAPYDDTEAYERSSPIYLAEGLEDHLLIQHGVQDDNVHFQDSVRLAKRLLELRKENWEIMIYPVEAHSLQNEDYNRYDVMRRRVDLFNGCSGHRRTPNALGRMTDRPAPWRKSSCGVRHGLRGGLVRSGRLTGSRSQESEGRSQEEAGGLLQLISAGRRCPRPAKDRR